MLLLYSEQVYCTTDTDYYSFPCNNVLTSYVNMYAYEIPVNVVFWLVCFTRTMEHNIKDLNEIIRCLWMCKYFQLHYPIPFEMQFVMDAVMSLCLHRNPFNNNHISQLKHPCIVVFKDNVFCIDFVICYHR